MNVIASLKHTRKDHEHIVFWRPDHRGYTPVLDRAGLYSEIDSADLNDGVDCIAIPMSAAVAVAVPTPFFKPERQFYDEAGCVVENTRANWNALVKASIEAGRQTEKPKPEVFRGKRRCMPQGEPA